MDERLENLVNYMVLHGAIKTETVKNAFLSIPRERFFSSEYKKFAFEDSAFPLEESGSTISQPSTIAIMFEMLGIKKGQKVLEVGSGSGYVLALLNKITEAKVFGIEINEPLVKKSKKILGELGAASEVAAGDGKKGMEKEAPFDRILLSARVDSVPQRLFNQLKDNGKLLAPVGGTIQSLVLFDKNGNVLEQKDGFVFVELQ